MSWTLIGLKQQSEPWTALQLVRIAMDFRSEILFGTVRGPDIGTDFLSGT